MLLLLFLPALTVAGTWEQQGSILRGIVVDQDGNPIAGAQVSVQRWDEGRSFQSVTTTGSQRASAQSDTSEADGGFTVLGLFPRVEYRVRFEKDGFIPRETKMILRVAVNDRGTWVLVNGDVERARDAYERGYAAYSAGRLQDAMAPMEEVAEVYGDSDSSDEMLIVALGVLGQGYLQQNRVADAEARLARLLSIAPDSGIALRGLGQVGAMSGRMGAASEHLEAYLAAAPGAPDTAEVQARIAALR